MRVTYVRRLPVPVDIACKECFAKEGSGLKEEKLVIRVPRARKKEEDGKDRQINEFGERDENRRE